MLVEEKICRQWLLHSGTGLAWAQWRIQGGKGRILKDFFTIEQSIICKNLEEVINNIGILVQQNLLAICFPNCV